MSRRKQKYVDFEVQSLLIRQLGCHWVLFILANVIASAFWVRVFEYPHSGAGDFWQLCLERVAPAILVSVLMLPVFILDAIQLTNRFVGPMARVKKSLAQIAKGEHPDAIEFRENDCWQAMANDINQVASFARSSSTTKHELSDSAQEKS